MHAIGGISRRVGFAAGLVLPIVVSFLMPLHADPVTQTWNSTSGFSSTQGGNGWSYAQQDTTWGHYDTMSYKAGPPPYWSYGSQTQGVYQDSAIPTTSKDMVRYWTAPAAMWVRVDATVNKKAAGGDGAVLAIANGDRIQAYDGASGGQRHYVGPNSYWEKQIAAGDTAVDTLRDYLYVQANEQIRIAVNHGGATPWGNDSYLVGDSSADETQYDVTITRIDDAALPRNAAPVLRYNATKEYDASQGPQWAYYSVSLADFSFAPLVFDTVAPAYDRWISATDSNQVLPTSIKPGATTATGIGWEAPCDMVGVHVQGYARKLASGGDGALVALNNATPTGFYWQASLGASDTGTKPIDTFIPFVRQGDVIALGIHNFTSLTSSNGDNAADETRFGLNITGEQYTSSTNPEARQYVSSEGFGPPTGPGYRSGNWMFRDVNTTWGHYDDLAWDAANERYYHSTTGAEITSQTMYPGGWADAALVFQSPLEMYDVVVRGYVRKLESGGDGVMLTLSDGRNDGGGGNQMSDYLDVYWRQVIGADDTLPYWFEIPIAHLDAGELLQLTLNYNTFSPNYYGTPSYPGDRTADRIEYVLVIEGIRTPEPAALALLGLGAFLALPLFRNRWRQG